MRLLLDTHALLWFVLNDGKLSRAVDAIISDPTNYDLHAIFLDIKKREKERGLHFVDGVAHQPMPNQMLQQKAEA